MVACELGYDDPGIEGAIPNDAVYFVHFVFSFGLFEWLNQGLGEDGAVSARFFWGLGFFDKFLWFFGYRIPVCAGMTRLRVSVFSDRFLLRWRGWIPACAGMTR